MIGTRIRQARVASGMTQDEVVAALADHGVALTKGGLSKYERGGSTPKAPVLRALGSVLGVRADFFLEEPAAHVKWLAFRKAPGLTQARAERVKALAEAQVAAFLTLRRALEPARSMEPLPHIEASTFEHAETAADALRARWRLGDQPVESVTEAIEDGGGIVVESGGEDDLFDGLSGWADEATPVVVVSVAVSDDRRRFSLAHELGHLVMRVEGVDEKTQERLAHRFAAAFLVSAATARRELGERRRSIDFRELMALKMKHGLSMQAWILRAADVGIIDEAHCRTLFAELSAKGWRKIEPVRYEGRERPTRLRQLTLRALAEGLITAAQAERLCPEATAEITAKEPPRPAASMDARALMKLPREERDRLMAQAAELVARDYEAEGGLTGFEMLSEGDHHDVSLDD